MFDYQTDPDFDEGPEGEIAWRAWQEALTGELIHVAGCMNAMDYYFIKLLTRYDRHECWTGDGVKSFAHWLNWKCGIDVRLAREKIRVARCLQVLPETNEAFRTGRISYSKARALTRAATPENETLLLERALNLTTEHVEHLVRRFKKAQVPGDPPQQQHEPYLIFHEDDEENSGMMQLHARLPVEDGMLVQKAIEKMTNRMRQDHAYGQKDSQKEDSLMQDATLKDADLEQELIEQQTKECSQQPKKVSAETFLERTGGYRFGRERARALLRIAEHYLASSDHDEDKSLSGSEKYHIVVHVNANNTHPDCLINKGACTYIEDGKFLAPEVASRLACNASRTTVLEDDNGNVLNVGRRSRIVPRAIELAVDIRDNHTCRFPNCHQRGHTDKHHIVTWAHGGETSVKNLISLCRYHHARLHEGECHIERIDRDDGSYDFAFINRDGEVIQRGLDPQFPDYDYSYNCSDSCDFDDVSAGEIVPPVEIVQPVDSHSLPALKPKFTLKEKPTIYEAQIERNKLTLDFYRGAFQCREPRHSTYGVGCVSRAQCFS